MVGSVLGADGGGSCWVTQVKIVKEDEAEGDEAGMKMDVIA